MEILGTTSATRRITISARRIAILEALSLGHALSAATALTGSECD